MRSQAWMVALALGALHLNGAGAQELKPGQINDAQFTTSKAESRALIAKLQILLDRAAFSPGVIDGRMGRNVEKALAAFREEHGLSKSAGRVDTELWSKLTERAPTKVIAEYSVTKDDVNGPFTQNIPEGFEKQKDLDRLGYTGPAELLAEKFHMDEAFLKELNPDIDFSEAGATIMVANVKGEQSDGRAQRIVVDKGAKQVRVYGEDDKLLAAYPATIGSPERPAPNGTYEVRAVAADPTYTYDPELKFEGVDAKQPFTIAPGPNNPVGSVWIDLSKEGYGIHGTPNPESIGKTSSHGCVRLTNWDAKSLAKMVGKGVKVEFLGGS